MAVSRRRNSLNPDADPFLYPAPKKESLSVAMPIFNISHDRFSQWKTMIPPVHGFVCYVEPISRLQYQYYTSSCNAVNSAISWPSSAGFAGGICPPENAIKAGCDLGGIVKVRPRRSQARLNKIEIKTEAQEMMGVDDAVSQSSTPDDMMMRDEITTVMIKNIPNQFRRHDLLSILDAHCKLENRSYEGCRSEYDFVYLPMDFRKFWCDRKVSNLGYAFVNFTSTAAASKFRRVYHRREWEVTLNKKVCEVNPAKIQGTEALKGAFRNKIFWCHTNQYLPVKLEPPSDGCRWYRATSVGKRVPSAPPKPMKKCYLFI